MTKPRDTKQLKKSYEGLIYLTSDAGLGRNGQRALRTTENHFSTSKSHSWV